MGKGRRQLAGDDTIKVVIKTPAAQQPVCRGFYQVEEDSLYVPLYPEGKFYSFLDSHQVIFDIDQNGRLLFLQVLTPRRKWAIRNNLKPPMNQHPADIRFLGFREIIPEAKLETSPDHSWLRLLYQKSPNASAYRVADHLLFELAEDKTLASIWIMAIENDRAARAMAAWRKQMKNGYHKRQNGSQYTRVEVRRPPQ